MTAIPVPEGFTSHPEGPLPALVAGQYLLGADPWNALNNRLEFRKTTNGKGAMPSVGKFQFAVDGWRVNSARPSITQLLHGVNIRGAQTEYIPVSPTPPLEFGAGVRTGGGVRLTDSIIEGFCFGVQVSGADHVYLDNMRLGACWAGWGQYGNNDPEADYALNGFTPMDGMRWAAFAVGPANRINRLKAIDGGHIGFAPQGQCVGFWKMGQAQLGQWNQYEAFDDNFLMYARFDGWTMENLGHAFLSCEDGISNGRVLACKWTDCSAPHTPNLNNVFTAEAAWVARAFESCDWTGSPELTGCWGTQATFKCQKFFGNKFAAKLPATGGKRTIIAGGVQANQIAVAGGNGTAGIVASGSAPIKPGDRVVLSTRLAYGYSDMIRSGGSVLNHDPIALETGAVGQAVVIQMSGRAPKFIADANGNMIVDPADRDGVAV